MEVCTANRNVTTARVVVDELKSLGIDHFVYCPGSRCTPLGLALEGEDVLVHYDERGAAFYALGYARATGKPAPLICTSGTALANFYPAVVEAYQENLPLLLLTSDRPAELWNTGANQTIDQVKFFGEYAHYVQLGGESVGCVQTSIDQAIGWQGPCQVNLSFSKPLQGDAELLNLKRPQTRYLRGKQKVPLHLHGERGVITVGRVDSEERKFALELAEALQWPLLPDPRSGLRLAGRKSPQIISHYGAMLCTDWGKELLSPDVVLHIGRPMLTILWKHPPKEYIWVSPDSRRYGENHDVTLRVCARGDELEVEANPLPEWTARLRAASDKIASQVDEYLEGSDGEIAFVHRIAKGTEPLFFANSLPIRHFDLWAPDGDQEVIVDANRGASGIDGQVATAAGFAKGLDQRVTLIIGDTSLLHDINSLPLAKGRVKVVVLNNDGGAIFTQLPINGHAKEFEKLWINPHGMDFRAAAEQFGLKYGEELFEVASCRQELEDDLRALKAKL